MMSVTLNVKAIVMLLTHGTDSICADMSVVHVWLLLLKSVEHVWASHGRGQC